MSSGSPPAPHPYPGSTTAAADNPLWLHPPSRNNTFGIATPPNARTATTIAAPGIYLTDTTDGGTNNNNGILRLEAMMVRLSAHFARIEKRLDNLSTTLQVDVLAAANTASSLLRTPMPHTTMVV